MSDVKNELQVVFEVDGSEVKLTQKIVQDYLVSDGQSISLPEFKMFTELCKVRKLNPFLKEAYIIKYGSEPAQLVVGKDAILKRAIKHPKFNGRQQGVIVLTDKGELLERNGTFKLDTEKLVGAWAKVFRKDWEFPTYVTVSFDEVAQKKKDGTFNSNWAFKGATMVEKVALVRALRETFVEELGGMIDEDEAWSSKDMSNRKTEKEIVHQSDPLEAVVTEKTVSLDEI